MTAEEFDQMSPDEQDWYMEGGSFEAFIQCGMCGRIVEVGGAVWKSRLRTSKTEVVKDPETGKMVRVYLGWNCDRCADAIEGGYAY